MSNDSGTESSPSTARVTELENKRRQYVGSLLFILSSVFCSELRFTLFLSYFLYFSLKAGRLWCIANILWFLQQGTFALA